MYSVPLLESRPRFLGNVALNLKFNLGHLQCLSTKHAIKTCDLSKALTTAGTVMALRVELGLRLMLVHDICRSTQLRFQLRRVNSGSCSVQASKATVREFWYVGIIISVGSPFLPQVVSSVTATIGIASAEKILASGASEYGTDFCPLVMLIPTAKLCRQYCAAECSGP
jgi:hypothetical protein